MAMLMPHRVNRVLRRLRQRFFHANPVNESWDAIILETLP
jgi:acetolactate synthase regulatory subunit